MIYTVTRDWYIPFRDQNEEGMQVEYEGQKYHITLLTKKDFAQFVSCDLRIHAYRMGGPDTLQLGTAVVADTYTHTWAERMLDTYFLFRHTP